MNPSSGSGHHVERHLSKFAHIQLRLDDNSISIPMVRPLSGPTNRLWEITLRHSHARHWHSCHLTRSHFLALYPDEAHYFFKVILLGIISKVCFARTSVKTDSGTQTRMTSPGASHWARGRAGVVWPSSETMTSTTPPIEERSLSSKASREVRVAFRLVRVFLLKSKTNIYPVVNEPVVWFWSSCGAPSVEIRTYSAKIRW